jgi:hypothetical protein
MLGRIWKLLFAHGAGLSPDEMRESTRIVTLAVVSLFLVVLLFAVRAASGSDQPSAVGMQGSDALVRLLTSLGAWCATAGAAYLTLQAWDNTSRARAILHDHPIGAAIVDAAIIVSAALVFGRVVGL